MKIQAYHPSELLKPFVLLYLLVDADNEFTTRLLPYTSTVMAFRYRGDGDYVVEGQTFRAPRLTFSGLRRTFRIYSCSKNTGVALVVLKEAGSGSFFRTPLNELFDNVAPLDCLVSHQASSILEEQLSEADNDEKRIYSIERFLLSALRYTEPDRLILSSLQKIHSTRGTIRIRELTGLLHISQDAFEKRFRRVVGTSPKQFSSIVRMLSVVRRLSEGRKFPVEAFDAGYYDQPHFIRAFKSFTGQTPTEFLTSPSHAQITDFLQ